MRKYAARFATHSLLACARSCLLLWTRLTQGPHKHKHIKDIVEKYQRAGASPFSISVINSYIHNNTHAANEENEPTTLSPAWVKLRYHPFWATAISRAISQSNIPGYRLRVAWKNALGGINSRVNVLNLGKIQDQ